MKKCRATLVIAPAGIFVFIEMGTLFRPIIYSLSKGEVSMKTHCCRKIIFLLIAAVAVTVIACNDKRNSPVEKNSEQQSLPPLTKPAMANPAAAQCVEDGYILEPVVENGVSVGHFCIDPETGLKCEIWKYFRKECIFEQ